MSRGSPRSNPLALAVLACLYERSMHPYEVATLLRERSKHESIKLNYGSLYTVVELLQRRGLIEPQEKGREGRRPERTIYRLTDGGSIEFVDWLSEILSTPVKEFTRFEAGLSLMPGLPPGDVVSLLDQRCRRLEVGLAQMRSLREVVDERVLPRLFWIESEYRIVLRQAELEWTRRLAREIEAGTLDGMSLWLQFQAEHDSGPRGDDGLQQSEEVIVND
ncbi:MAG: PadR family transcriptional regulator [Dehalococcoidia bacterium]|jgi:DNA-binding PadR family transcriptional regulator